MSALSNNPGRLFIVSFPENLPRDETLYFIQDNRIAGIILFANHCRDQDNLRSWLHDFKKTLDYKLIVAIDQEGGRVRRLTRGFPILEAPRYYGEHNKFDRYRDDLSRVCDRLLDIGITMNLVPAVDLFDTEEGHVLDTRTFADDIETVNRFAEITIKVHHEQGLLTCGKHFPGLGRTAGDPHDTLAVSDLEEKDFFERELKPFRQIIIGGVDSIMVTHIKVPKVDVKPSIVSEKIISGWLKEKLNFDRAVISDDLLMAGAEKAAALPMLACDCLNAGVDILLFGQALKKTREAYIYVAESIEEGEVAGSRLKQALEKSRALSDGINA